MKTILMFAAAAAATPAAKPALAPSEIVAAAPAGDWVAIAAADLLVMDLASGKRVVIQLMPPPFSQGWIGNIRKLAAAHWWDGTSINRVQDNYVVQWGDANGEGKATAKALPVELVRVPEFEYTAAYEFLSTELATTASHELSQISLRDPYFASSGFLRGWAVAASIIPITHKVPEKNSFGGGGLFPVHCYGMVGVGRGMPPDTGSGAELYTVIGHAPRHLDRNIALVGRVILGIEHLSSLPRGTGDLGFYKTPAERTGITSIRLGTEVKDLQRFEYLSTESTSFAAYADARANRRDAFFIRPAGGADICNIPVPVRVAK